jgi:hypothetical protein
MGIKSGKGAGHRQTSAKGREKYESSAGTENVVAEDLAAKQSPELDTFLESIRLGGYRELFLAHNFATMQTILELSDEDLQRMNLPLGHKLKVLKRIKGLQPTQENAKQISHPRPAVPQHNHNIHRHKSHLQVATPILILSVCLKYSG